MRKYATFFHNPHKVAVAMKGISMKKIERTGCKIVTSRPSTYRFTWDTEDAELKSLGFYDWKWVELGDLKQVASVMCPTGTPFPYHSRGQFIADYWMVNGVDRKNISVPVFTWLMRIDGASDCDVHAMCEESVVDVFDFNSSQTEVFVPAGFAERVLEFVEKGFVGKMRVIQMKMATGSPRPVVPVFECEKPDGSKSIIRGHTAPRY